MFPGDGICPFNKVLPLLYDSGFRGGLSVELLIGDIGKPWMKGGL